MISAAKIASSSAAKIVVHIESPTWCNVPLGRAKKLQQQIESKSNGSIKVEINPTEPRRDCFVIASSNGVKIVEHLKMKTANPGRWGPLRDMDIDAVAQTVVDKLM